MGRIYNNIVETVGRTPLVKLNKVTAGLDATILLKCEFFNPLGSVKDRIGMAMIEDAEKRGVLKKDTVIIEPTSGNTGIALAFVAAAKGYKLILTMPETMSLERRTLLAMLGREAGPDAGRGRHEGRHRPRRSNWPRKRRTPGFRSSSTTRPTRRSTRKTTAEEIWDDTDGKVDILVAAVGTGGTITGCCEVIKPSKPSFQAIAVEPKDSPVISQTLAGQPVKPGPHKIQGTGAGFVPKNLHLKDSAGQSADRRVRPGDQRRRVCHGAAAGQGRGHPGRHLHRRECLGGHRSGQAPGEQGQADRHHRLLDRRTLPEHGAGGGSPRGRGRLSRRPGCCAGADQPASDRCGFRELLENKSCACAGFARN